MVRCHEPHGVLPPRTLPAWPEVSARGGWNGWAAAIQGVNRQAQPGRWAVRSGAEECSGPHLGFRPGLRSAPDLQVLLLDVRRPQAQPAGSEEDPEVRIFS